jgi:hypothetical protein
MLKLLISSYGTLRYGAYDGTYTLNERESHDKRRHGILWLGMAQNYASARHAALLTIAHLNVQYAHET